MFDVIVLTNCSCCGEKSIGFYYLWKYFVLLSSVFSLSPAVLVTETDSLVALALEICATIPPDVNPNFKLRKLTYTSVYYFLHNLNYSNCIDRFIGLNKCSNSAKFVWARLRSRHMIGCTLPSRGCMANVYL